MKQKEEIRNELLQCGLCGAAEPEHKIYCYIAALPAPRLWHHDYPSDACHKHVCEKCLLGNMQRLEDEHQAGALLVKVLELVEYMIKERKCLK